MRDRQTRMSLPLHPGYEAGTSNETDGTRAAASASGNPAIAARPSRTCRLDPARSSPIGSQRPPRWPARNASVMALNDVRL